MAEINVDTILKLQKIHRIGILVGIVVVFAGLYYFLMYSSHSENLKNQRALETKKQHEQQEQDAVLANLPRFKKEAAEMKKKRQEALAQLPDRKDIDKLLKDISFYALESGLEILLFKPQVEIRKNFYAEIPVDVKLSGTYHNLATFFDKIANFSRIVKIAEIHIDKAKEIDGRNVLQTSCKATTYRFIEEKPGGKNKKSKK